MLSPASPHAILSPTAFLQPHLHISDSSSTFLHTLGHIFFFFFILELYNAFGRVFTTVNHLRALEHVTNVKVAIV